MDFCRSNLKPLSTWVTHRRNSRRCILRRTAVGYTLSRCGIEIVTRQSELCSYVLLALHSLKLYWLVTPRERLRDVTSRPRIAQ